jgi:hypothetical protein
MMPTSAQAVYLVAFGGAGARGAQDDKSFWAWITARPPPDRASFLACGGPRLLGDNLARCLTILMRALALRNLFDPKRWLCLLSSSGSSSVYYPSGLLDG